MSIFLSCFGQENTTNKPKKKFDKTMIGNPTNFTHNVHLGVNSISDDTLTSENVNLLKCDVLPRNNSYYDSAQTHHKNSNSYSQNSPKHTDVINRPVMAT
ncbi:hypothetical protein BB561_005452 [Smittium simulii]|uniref:CRIB domain-containing protein n=1 Tax=Smittium simulii TaxID=133385 RepID=A0A2T9YAD6_9FUNG|nr:hypothetical protein BB561_005452 [Smittium simulii]